MHTNSIPIDIIRSRSKLILIVSLQSNRAPLVSPTFSFTSLLIHNPELKAAGIDEIMVYCVNDPAVMDAWAKDQKVVDTHVTFYSDPYGTFTKHFDMELTHPGPVGKGLVGRCKRFALYIDDGEVKYQALAEDPDFDPAGDDFPEKCMPEQMLAAIAKL